MFAKTIYKAVESAIKQGGLKLKNESKPSWVKYVLDFLFYIRYTRYNDINMIPFVFLRVLVTSWPNKRSVLNA